MGFLILEHGSALMPTIFLANKRSAAVSLLMRYLLARTEIKKRLTSIAVATAALFVTAPATAAVMIDLTSPGSSFTVAYGGQVNGTSADRLSAAQMFTFDGVAASGRTLNFSYSLANTSVNQSRIRSFGFDVVEPTAGPSVTASGSYGIASTNGQFPEELGRRDVCLIAARQGNCTGGPGGLTRGQDGSGTFALTFQNPVTSLTLDNFAVRYQSISPTINSGTSGVGVGTLGMMGAVPEPATWAFLILGFGAVGASLRRRGRAAGLLLTA